MRQRGFGFGPSSWLDQWVAVCSSLLVGAAMFYLAYRILLSIWPWLLVAVLIALPAYGYWLVRRRRLGGW